MNPNPPDDRDDRLWQAVLADESWQAESAAGRATALAAFRARQQGRRLVRRLGVTGGLTLLLAVALWGLHRPAPLASEPKEAAAPSGRFLTDRELLGAFPPGSCFLAEVDGQMQLVFNDPAVERLYLQRNP